MSNHFLDVSLPLDPADDSSDLHVALEIAYLPGCPASFDDPGYEPEVEIIDVLPYGCPPPLDPEVIYRLAMEWLNEGEGYKTCCAFAEEERRAA
jgi:hypothetical protein